MKDLQEVVDKVKGIEDGVTNLIIPILKDTINDGNVHNKRSHIINIILALALVIVSITSMFIISKQNEKYAEFLSQFEFETEVIQELNSDNSSASTINDGINITK